jgi:Arc/MetJ-type ribon-helix-helix transcriptional regulator
MKKLLIYLDENMHEDLKELAHRQKTSMSELVRYALDKTFEDALDVIAGERGLEEALNDPSATMTLDEYLEKRGLDVPRKTASKSPKSTRQVARSRS